LRSQAAPDLLLNGPEGFVTIIMPMGQFFLIVPLGMVTNAIPISPGGVGIGQTAFFALFQIVALRYTSAGVDAVTVFQVMYLMVCLSGLYWYVSYKHVDPAGEKAHASIAAAVQNRR
jgi:uncharacterized membrane protein YbhN (UPF0104 family)